MEPTINRPPKPPIQETPADKLARLKKWYAKMTAAIADGKGGPKRQQIKDKLAATKKRIEEMEKALEKTT